jgi:hypothetical protein
VPSLRAPSGVLRAVLLLASVSSSRVADGEKLSVGTEAVS